LFSLKSERSSFGNPIQQHRLPLSFAKGSGLVSYVELCFIVVTKPIAWFSFAVKQSS
jgi:hypothetical protein